MNHLLKIALAISALLASMAQAAPWSMSYSGRLVDAGGAPLAGEVDLVFDFYSAPTLGTLLASKSAHATLAQGVFSVNLTFDEAESLVIFTAPGGVWIETKDTTNSRTYARQAFQAVPFAYRAETLAPGTAVTGNILAFDGAKWVPTAPGTATIADGDVTDQKIAAGVDAAKIGGGAVSNTEFSYLNNVSSSIQTQLDGKAATSHSHAASAIGGGTVDDTEFSYLNNVTGAIQTQLNAKQASLTTGTGTQYFKGDLSLGTFQTDVSANADVTANTAARHAAVTLGTANGLSLSTQQLSLGLASTSTAGALSSADWNTFNNKVSSQWATSGSDISYSAGNVGIGTTNPAAKLSVTGGALEIHNNVLAVGAELFVHSDTTWKAPTLDLYRSRGSESSQAPVGDGDQLGYVNFLGYGTDYAVGSGIVSSAKETWTAAAHGADLQFVTTPVGSTTNFFRMTIAADGNVGIGTTAPDTHLEVESAGNTKLHVDGAWDAFVNVDRGTTTNYALVGFQTAGANTAFAGLLDDGKYHVTDGSFASKFTVDYTTGNVGVGTVAPHSSLQVAGAVATAFSAKTAAYTLVASDSIVTGNATGGAFSLTLPTAVGIAGRQYTLKKVDASANAVTVATTSAQTIDGSTTVSLASQHDYVTVVSDGANWIVTASKLAAAGSSTKAYSARVMNNGSTCTIATEAGSWLDSATRNGTGRCDLVITSGAFAAAPACTCTGNADNGGFSHICGFLNPSDNTQLEVTTEYGGGVQDDVGFEITCIGP